MLVDEIRKLKEERIAASQKMWDDRKKESLRHYPQLLEVIIESCKYWATNGYIILNQEERYLQYSQSSSKISSHLVTLLEEKFEDIKEFGISNGFTVTADREYKVIRRNSRGLLYFETTPSITFQW